MGKLILPKQTGQLDRFIYSLEIFYDAYQNDNINVSNDLFKTEITNRVPEFKQNNDGAKIVKQSELTRYFGFATHDYINNVTSITKRGIEFYTAYRSEQWEKLNDLLFDSIKNDSFGRNNTAIKNSDSNIDPPKVFIKAILDLDGISNDEFAYLLYALHDMESSYHDAFETIIRSRMNSEQNVIQIPKNKGKYKDIKFIVFLKNIKFIHSVNNINHLSKYVYNKYYDDISVLNIYNDKAENTNKLLNYIEFVESNEFDLLTTYIHDVNKVEPYKIDNDSFNRKNNRIPITSEKTKYSDFKTDPKIAKTALYHADYKCEYNPNHVTFISKYQVPFMEAHHLIPMAAQSDFKVNLDRIENIISLCPICHSAIHYGDENTSKKIVEKLFNDRKKKLFDCDIDISLDNLFYKYYK